MILYRLQVHAGKDWTNTWYRTSTSAILDCEHYLDRGIEARVDKIDVPTDKAGLAEALNRADCNYMNWEGERIK